MHYQTAIEWLERKLGRATPGPLPGIVTFTIEGDDYRATVPIPEDQIVQVAEISMRACARNLPLQNCSGCTDCACH